MLDYDALHCLNQVLRYESFERGAKSLNLTQSAVSQKIKRLEQSVGGPVLIRTKPVAATPLGQKLLLHVQKVNLLEQELSVSNLTTSELSPLPVAVNNDVLATWFSGVMAEFAKTQNNPVHIYNAEQSETRAMLQKGKVMACISDIGTPVTGGESMLLGKMEYKLYASPNYVSRYLKRGIDAESVMKAPGLLYDELDVSFLSQYQEEQLGLTPSFSHCHWYPSSHGFAQMAIDGVAWSLLPTLQAEPFVDKGQLLSLFPERVLSLNLYWHWIGITSQALLALTDAVKRISEKSLGKA